jgi:hypothetical protein
MWIYEKRNRDGKEEGRERGKGGKRKAELREKEKGEKCGCMRRESKMGEKKGERGEREKETG